MLTQEQTAGIAHSLIVRLNLPQPEIQVGPDTTTGEHHMLFVGVPYWFWTTTETSKTAQISQAGQTFTLSAQRTAITLTTGDGHTIECLTASPRPAGATVRDASPDCGHTYTQPSHPNTYTVQATARWRVHWTALGMAGDLDTTTTAQRNLTLGELQTIRVG